METTQIHPNNNSPLFHWKKNIKQGEHKSYSLDKRSYGEDHMERCLVISGETKTQEAWRSAADNIPGQQKQLFLPQAWCSELLERKRAAEGTQVNSFKRCKPINHNRIGKSPRITDTQQKIAYIKLKTHDQNISDSKRERERAVI